MNRNTCFIIVAITWFASVLFFTGAGYFAYSNSIFKESSISTKATIIELIKGSSTSGSSTTRIYTPVFTYKDESGKEYKHKSKYSSSTPAGNIGDQIDVLYNPENPNDVKIDTWFSNWGVTTILGGLGTANFLVGFVFLVIWFKGSANQ